MPFETIILITNVNLHSIMFFPKLFLLYCTWRCWPKQLHFVAWSKGNLKDVKRLHKSQIWSVQEQGTKQDMWAQVDAADRETKRSFMQFCISRQTLRRWSNPGWNWRSVWKSWDKCMHSGNKPYGKRPLGWPRRRWKDSIKIHFKPTGCIWAGLRNW
jgi:hypothetical protein